MYYYIFNIYFKKDNLFYMAIHLNAKDKFSRYESILIRDVDLDEKCENWITNEEDSKKKKKKAPYGIEIDLFFQMLDVQSVWSIPSHVGDWFSPYELYHALNRAKMFVVSVDTDDPRDIGNEEDVRAYVAAHYAPNVDY